MKKEKGKRKKKMKEYPIFHFPETDPGKNRMK
jgi:hypothetical protein